MTIRVAATSMRTAISKDRRPSHDRHGFPAAVRAPVRRCPQDDAAGVAFAGHRRRCRTPQRRNVNQHDPGRRGHGVASVVVADHPGLGGGHRRRRRRDLPGSPLGVRRRPEQPRPTAAFLVLAVPLAVLLDELGFFTTIAALVDADPGCARALGAGRAGDRALQPRRRGRPPDPALRPIASRRRGSRAAGVPARPARLVGAPL
jgi:hypothetical protein